MRRSPTIKSLATGKSRPSRVRSRSMSGTSLANLRPHSRLPKPIHVSTPAGLVSVESGLAGGNRASEMLIANR
jgi:hypothetical protein